MAKSYQRVTHEGEVLADVTPVPGVTMPQIGRALIGGGRPLSLRDPDEVQVVQTQHVDAAEAAKQLADTRQQLAAAKKEAEDAKRAAAEARKEAEAARKEAADAKKKGGGGGSSK
jgi:hypothetical protein